MYISRPLSLSLSLSRFGSRSSYFLYNLKVIHYRWLRDASKSSSYIHKLVFVGLLALTSFMFKSPPLAKAGLRCPNYFGNDFICPNENLFLFQAPLSRGIVWQPSQHPRRGQRLSFITKPWWPGDKTNSNIQVKQNTHMKHTYIYIYICVCLYMYAVPIIQYARFSLCVRVFPWRSLPWLRGLPSVGECLDLGVGWLGPLGLSAVCGRPTLFIRRGLARFVDFARWPPRCRFMCVCCWSRALYRFCHACAFVCSRSSARVARFSLLEIIDRTNGDE